MNADPVNNDAISIDYISSEQHPPGKNQPDEYSTNSNEIFNRIDPMNKSRFSLVCSSWLTRRALIIVGTIILFVIAIIIVVPMVVCLTRPIQTGHSRELVLKSLTPSSIIKDPRPHAVAIGDFNNDGLPDIVVPNSGVNNIAVFLRQTNMTLTNPFIYSTGLNSTPFAVAVADFNHDYQLDIAVANYGTNTIGIFFGIGDGTFRPQITFPTGSSRPRSIAVADFDNDARTDIAVVYYGTGTIGVFLQDMDGNFINQATLFTGYDSDSYALAVGDLNNDQKNDIVVANYGTDNVSIFLGYGNGTFAIQIVVTTGVHSHPSSIAISDLNSDSYFDIVVICSGTNDVGVLLGYGNGTFATPTMYSTGNNSVPRSVAIADFDNDHKLDIAVANYGSDSVIVLLGDGNGYFSNPDRMFFTSSYLNPYSIATADFNGDNQFDIAVVNYDFNNVDIILNYRHYSFHSQTTYNTYDDSLPTSIVTTDLNNDNHRDMIVANYWSNNVWIFLGNGDGTFSSRSVYSTGPFSRPCSLAVGDFNNDLLIDFVVTYCGTNNIGVFLGNGNGMFSTQTTFSTGENSHPFAVAVGDFNNDFRLDIVVANFGTDNIGVFLGYGDGTFLSQVSYSTGSGSGPTSITTSDFNSDNQPDIVVANFGTNNIGVFLGHGNGTFSNQNTFSTGFNSTPSSVAVGDFNNDSRTDIIVANYGTDTIGLFLGQGSGIFSKSITFSTGANSGPRSIVIGDFNNDNQLDVSVADRWSDNIGVFIGYGNGSFSSQTTYSTGNGSNPISVAIADLNEDGHQDITVANWGTSNIGILMGYGNGTFTTQLTMPTISSSNPMSVAIGDFNDDGFLDMTVANYWSNTIGIFLGHADGTFSNQITYNTGPGSAPYAISVGDFNKDRRLDIVVANSEAGNIGVFLGYGNGTFGDQTSFSTGSNSQPLAIAVGDFNNDNHLDIAVANYMTSEVKIFIGYGNGTFASQANYSTGYGSQPNSITIGDFNNDARLDIFVTSGAAGISIFLGYGNGTFSNQSTYFITKVAWPYDAVVGDLNGDDRLDIVVTLYSNSGIIVFLGNGDGTFSRQLIQSTGSQSRPTNCVLGDLNNDHRLDIVVSDYLNDAIVVLFGDGYGGFSNTRTYSTGTGSAPISVASGDFNNDSILDIVVTNYETNTIGVFLGFTYISGVREGVYQTGPSPHLRAIALADFNKDNQLDIVMTNYGSGNLEVLLQGANSTFPTQQILSTGIFSLPTSMAVGDFNNDSKLDITVANLGTENMGVFYGYGNGSFTSQTTFLTEFNFIPQSVAVGDFNSDKKLDIVVADSGTESGMTLLRYDIGALGSGTMFATGPDSLPMSGAVGDLNNDGQSDFVVANGGSDNIGVFLGFGNGTFSRQTTYSTGAGSFPQGVAVANLNNDSYLDIIVCNSESGNIGILLGFGNGTFSNQLIYSTDHTSAPIAIAFDDLNNDRRLDIVVVNYYSDTIGLFFGNNDGTFSSIITYSTGSYSRPCSIAIGDFNNDNQSDIVVANIATGNLGIFIGSGNGIFSVMSSYSTGRGSAPMSIAVGDFNHDDRLDVAVANSGTDSIGVLFGDGNGTLSSLTTYSVGNDFGPSSVVIGDFNNDDQLDIAVANYGSNSFSILLGFVDGTFFSPLNYFIADGSQPIFIAVGKFNNDDRMDIIITNSGTNDVGIFLGYANENFLFAPTYSIGILSQPTSIAIGDFDNDTRLDIVVANNGTDNLMVLFGSGYGTFIRQMSYSTGNDSNPCSVAIGHLNNDSRLDIVVANSGTNNVGIFLGNGSGTFSSQMTYSTGLDSQPHSVAILDCNNDTLLDIVVTNYGNGSISVFFGYGDGRFSNGVIFSTGFGSFPYGIAAGDVNNDNLTDAVITNDGYSNIDILSME